MPEKRTFNGWSNCNGIGLAFVYIWYIYNKPDIYRCISSNRDRIGFMQIFRLFLRQCIVTNVAGYLFKEKMLWLCGRCCLNSPSSLFMPSHMTSRMPRLPTQGLRSIVIRHYCKVTPHFQKISLFSNDIVPLKWQRHEIFCHFLSWIEPTWVPDKQEIFAK